MISLLHPSRIQDAIASVLEITFLTSNDTKLAHLQHLSRAYDISISKQQYYGVSYAEPRIDNRESLLRASINDAYKRLSKHSNADDRYFFIEDTSVTIPALSSEREVPGLDVKYWMRENDFESVDRQLKAVGNDRRAEVRSDIVLMVPRRVRLLIGQKKTYLMFSSSVSGHIVESESEFETQPFFPWLDNRSFNKWFVPNGAETVLSLLPIEQAIQFDFRRGAMEQMLQFLEEIGSIRKSRPDSGTGERGMVQVGLFEEPLVFLISGLTCAGKTTLAEYVIGKYDYYHFEASDFMYRSYFQRHGVGSNSSVGAFAEQALMEYPSIVVDQIIESLPELSNTPLIVTGFRSPDEVRSFKAQYSGYATVEIVYVDANADLRFERSVKRKRFDSSDRGGFDREDERQRRMGINEIREMADLIIVNESSFDYYFDQFESRFRANAATVERPLSYYGKFYKSGLGLEEEIVLSLFDQLEADHYFTTTEIAKLINKKFHPNEQGKSKNNVSRYFNQFFYPYYEIRTEGTKLTYRLSQTGIAHAKWLMRKFV